MDTVTMISLIAAFILAYIAFEASSRHFSRSSVSTSARLLLGERASLQEEEMPRLPTWQAALAGLMPKNFSPDNPTTIFRVRELLRRAGYPYRSEGEFFAAAIRKFTIYTAVGLFLAGLVAYKGQPETALIPAAAFILLGLRRPYTELNKLIHQRKKAMPYNMLPVLSSFYALIQSGVGVQEALRKTANIGGPFSNLMLFFLARLAADENPRQALAVVRRHVPDPDDPYMTRWLNILEGFFLNGQPIAEQTAALWQDLEDFVEEQLEERTSVALRQVGIYGVLAVLGTLITLMWPNVVLWRSLR